MTIEYRTEPEYWEYLDGEVHPKVCAGQEHAVCQLSVARLIADGAKDRGKVGISWDVCFPDREKRTKFIPDVAYFSFERLQAMSEEEREFPPCAPDIAVEILSPGDSRLYVEAKIALYLAHGSLVVLDVDPLARTIRVCRSDGTQSQLRGGQRLEDPRLPWLRFGVREIFADLDVGGPSTSSG